MGKAKRNTYMVFMNVGSGTTKSWEVFGKDIEDLSRELNNEVNSFTNILGEVEVDVTKGPQVTTVDPIKYRSDSQISAKLYDIYKNDKELSEVEFEFCEVNTTQEILGSNDAPTGTYEAFTQVGAIDLKSWGGDTTGINSPIDINWKGEKTYGAFDPSTKTFTANS